MRSALAFGFCLFSGDAFLFGFECKQALFFCFLSGNALSLLEQQRVVQLDALGLPASACSAAMRSCSALSASRRCACLERQCAGLLLEQQRVVQLERSASSRSASACSAAMRSCSALSARRRCSSAFERRCAELLLEQQRVVQPRCARLLAVRLRLFSGDALLFGLECKQALFFCRAAMRWASA